MRTLTSIAGDGIQLTPHTDTRYGLIDQAHVLGGSCWLERSMFEVLGGWSASETTPSIVIMLDDHAHRHLWHAEVLMDRIPELAQVDPQELVTAPDEGVVRAVEYARELGATLPRLVAGYRVICALLVVRHRSLLEIVGTVSSPSTHRWIGRIIDDLTDQWAEGEKMIRRLLDTVDDVDTAITHQSRLERMLIAANSVASLADRLPPVDDHQQDPGQ